MVEPRWTQWSEDHVAGHDVSWDEVEQALTPPIVRHPNRAETAVWYIGQTFGGRYLALLVAPDEDAATVFVITARRATTNERRYFLRRVSKG